MKNYLFILHKPPHSGVYVQEILDIILTAAAFDQAVSLLLLDDGVFQLKNCQSPEQLGMKDTAAIFKSLEVYDVKDIYVETESLQERGLNADDLCLSTQTLFRKDISGFISTFSVIFPS